MYLQIKQKLQNAFQRCTKNIVVLRGRWEETLATDILNMKEKVIQLGKYTFISTKVSPTAKKF